MQLEPPVDAPYMPAVHPVQPLDPLTDMIPAAHKKQLDDPELDEYSPEAQLKQDPEPAAEYVPAAQSTHVEGDTALIDGEFDPGAQLEQLSDPVFAW